MTAHAKSTVKIVSGILALTAFLLVVLAVAAGVILTRPARGDTVTLTADPFTINGVAPDEVYFAGFTGSNTFQAAYRVGIRVETVQCDGRFGGFPCECFPGNRAQNYELGTFAAGSLPLDLRSTSVSISGNTITLSDGAFIRTRPADWNGDGSVTVQDIFDFLTSQPTADEVFAFLEAWFSP